MSATATETADHAARLEALRAEIARMGVDGFMVPHGDAFQSEYPPASARRLEWLTGFNGSAGASVVTTDKAAVFVDGRYTVQVKQQVDEKLFEHQDFAPGYKTVREWTVKNLDKGGKVAYDPWLMTQSTLESLKEEFGKKGIELVPSQKNLIDTVWKDRPAQPQAPVKIHEEKFAGESSESKRTRLAKQLGGSGSDVALITMPDSIAWLLNIRGGDMAFNPFALSYATLDKNGKVDWFIDESKLSPEVRAHIGNAVTIRPMVDLESAIKALKGKTVQYDPKRSSAWFHDQLSTAGAKVTNGDDVCLLPKACKNPVEIEGIRQAHIRDGVAVSKLLCWLDEEAPKRPVNELEVEEKLLSFRKEQEHFQEPSFATIAGSADHGAIVHYKASKKSNQVLAKDTVFLLDSGGQYTDGTTDITRTVIIGKPTDEQKRRNTQVLKGHIALGSVRFPKGISGKELDPLARKALWAEGEDYAHGTGHGVGAYLGVHEGPQGISSVNTTPLEPGMVISNEPGFYKEGEFGIRIENLVVVRENEQFKGGKKPILEFETVTLAPIDRRLIDADLLNKEETQWLDAYHQRVYDTLSPLMEGKELKWLEAQTRPLSAEKAATKICGPHTEAVTKPQASAGRAK